MKYERLSYLEGAAVGLDVGNEVGYGIVVLHEIFSSVLLVTKQVNVPEPK